MINFNRYELTATVKAIQGFSIVKDENGADIDWSSVDEILENQELNVYDKEKDKSFTIVDVEHLDDERIIELIEEEIALYEKENDKEEEDDEC